MSTSIVKFLFESNITPKNIPKKDMDNIIHVLTKLAYEQALSWPKFDGKTQDFKLYPNDSIVYIGGKKQSDVKKYTNDMYFRISGYIQVDSNHTSDVVAFYYPKTGKYTIESNGVNG